METGSELNHINIEDEMRKSYLAYAMSVIVGRALPDVRDGLKPVHRRVLWAMHELGNTYNRPHKKSARVVGDVIGKYHPHGDVPVYDTIVRLTQDFSMRYQLIDGQGNFGSVDGDAPAAMRYTEVRMARLANQVLADIEKETVNFQPNYDESLHEPTVMPTRVPNLLINGSDGIAVGMATKIPPHNLTEIVDATIALVRDPEIDINKLTKIVTGPDFPTGGFIYGREEIKKSYLEGRGVLQIRAKAGIDRVGRGTQERDAIIITEIPFQVNKARLIERMAEQLKEIVAMLQKHKNVTQWLVEIHRLENEGDDIYHAAIAELFHDAHDALTVLKWKEVYEKLEAAVDRCENVANIIESVIIKHT